MTQQTILNYYFEDIEYHKVNGYEEFFNPGKWITSSSQIAFDFAKYIEYLLNNVKENNLTLARVSKLVHEFYYQCIAMHGILFDEECKKNKALKQLFFDTMYEINSLDDQYCNTSQLIIDLTLKLILQPQIVFDEYQILQTCNWEYLCITHLVKHSSFSDYLINCLEKNCDSKLIETILDNLSFQKDLRLFDTIGNYLCPRLPVDDKYTMFNIEIQSSALRYIRHEFFNRPSSQG